MTAIRPTQVVLPPINRPMVDRSGLMPEGEWYRYFEAMLKRTGSDNDAVAGAYTYADNIVAASIVTVKAYADAKDVIVLHNANIYSDSSSAAALVAANAHSDANDIVTLNAAKAYTDAEIAAYTPPVSSVFGRTGVVVAAANDYNFNQIAGHVDLTSQVTGLLPNANLAHSSVTISGHALSLGGALNLAAADISGLAASATTDTTNASNISSGTLPAGRLPNPSAASLGGIQSIAAVAHKFLTSISTGGVPALGQPAATDLSDFVNGNWTPVANVVTFTSASGNYLRLGSLVIAVFSVAFPAVGDGNTAEITGLPLTNGTKTGGAIISQFYGGTLYGFIQPGNAFVQFSNGAANLTNNDLAGQGINGIAIYNLN